MYTDSGVYLFTRQSHLSYLKGQGLAHQETVSTLQTQHDLQAVSSRLFLFDPSFQGFEWLEALRCIR